MKRVALTPLSFFETCSFDTIIFFCSFDTIIFFLANSRFSVNVLNKEK